MARNNRTADEVQIRQIIDRWAGAIRDKNIEAAVSHYARDILLYDLAPPLVHRGVDVYKKELSEWFATFQGAVGFEVHDLSITVGDGAAFATSLNHITGKRTSGEQTDVWVRATIGFAKQTADGRLRTSTSRCLSTWTAVTRRRSISSPDRLVRRANLAQPGHRAIHARGY
jgi:ketosteroid isomerase-like protein